MQNVLFVDKLYYFCYNLAVMIRKITANEKQLYLTLATEFYSSPAVLHPVPAAHLERTFLEFTSSDTYAEGYFLCEGETPVGYGLLAKSFSQEAGGKVIWIEELYLRPEARGRGLGREFFAFAETLGASRLRLEVEPDNARAIKLYEALGYTPLGYKQYVKER